ncbi:MAG TPA: hypothetical protein VMV40_01615 [Acidiferrobacter sp.]|nr:hypothetical protein [Acidiferrobacter sp.]
MLRDLAHYLLSHPSLAGLSTPFSGIPAGTLLLYAFIANGLIAVLLAKPIALLLPFPYRNQRTSWFFVILIATVPFLGLIVAISVATIITRLNRQTMVAEPQTITIPPFGVEMRARNIHMGAGGAWAIIRAKEPGTKRGVRALLALDPRASRQTSPLVRAALQHPEEDLRLLAFGLLDQREGRLAEVIKDTLDERENLPPRADLSSFEKRLAFLYWELIYQDLSRDHLRTLAIRHAKEHAHAAILLRPNDATLHILMGRIAMMEDRNMEAREHFENALSLNAAPAQILPYFAEVRFRVGDFLALRHLASDFPSLLDMPSIGPVVRFWAKTS